jgi:hypothetical protein
LVAYNTEGNEFQKAVSKIAQLILKLEQENAKLKAELAELLSNPK